MKMDTKQFINVQESERYNTYVSGTKNTNIQLHKIQQYSWSHEAKTPVFPTRPIHPFVSPFTK